MKPELLDLLCDPTDKSPLKLENDQRDEHGNIISGTLRSDNGNNYPIKNGIPRFVALAEEDTRTHSVDSFGDQWNHFNFDEFQAHWLNHTVKNTFGDVSAFKDKTIVDAGAGSGMQTYWMAQSGAKHVIALELSHSVDGIMQQNLKGLDNVDVIQCSIDQIPLKQNAINGLTICHNVIQHTPSVEKTAAALWEITAPNGELVFNCYTRDDSSLIQRLRFKVYRAARAFTSRLPFWGIMAYAHLMATLRFIPGLGWLLEKSMVMVRGDVPEGPNRMKRLYRAAVLNTFDYFGSHSYQHHKSFEELRALATQLQPDSSQHLNANTFFTRPQPIGVALRLKKS